MFVFGCGGGMIVCCGEVFVFVGVVEVLLLVGIVLWFWYCFVGIVYYFVIGCVDWCVVVVEVGY